MEKELDIIYEDNHLIVVVKPQNIPTQKDESEDEDMLSKVKEYIKEKYQKPGNVYVGLVHRLDRPTGGVMVFAKTSKAAARLSKQIQDCEMEKEYLTVLEGQLPLKTKTLVNYLKKDEENNMVKIAPMGETGAKRAELVYETLEVEKEFKEGDFVYFDPPYDLVEKYSFTDYSNSSFKTQEQIELKQLCDRLSEKNIKFMLSNSATDFIKELYKDYNVNIVSATRIINSKVSGRGAVEEVIVTNY